MSKKAKILTHKQALNKKYYSKNKASILNRRAEQARPNKIKNLIKYQAKAKYNSYQYRKFLEKKNVQYNIYRRQPYSRFFQSLTLINPNEAISSKNYLLLYFLTISVLNYFL